MIENVGRYLRPSISKNQVYKLNNKTKKVINRCTQYHSHLAKQQWIKSNGSFDWHIFNTPVRIARTCTKPVDLTFNKDDENDESI